MHAKGNDKCKLRAIESFLKKTFLEFSHRQLFVLFKSIHNVPGSLCMQFKFADLGVLMVVRSAKSQK